MDVLSEVIDFLGKFFFFIFLVIFLGYYFIDKLINKIIKG